MSGQSTDTPLFDLAEVEYRDIPGFPGYRVGSDGSVWSCIGKGCSSTSILVGKEWKKLKLVAWRRKKTNLTYYYVTLCCDGKQVGKRVNRLVLEAFVSSPPPGMRCCHINGISTDNRIENLYWGTGKDNENDKRRHGMLRLGSCHQNSRLTEENVREIRKLRKEGMSWNSLAARFGVAARTVRSVVSGKSWSWLT